MSPKILLAYECARCGEGITSPELSTNCPTCGLQLGGKGSRTYELPYTLTEQHLKLGDNERHIQVLVNMPVEKAASIMNDALNIMETITGKNDDVSGMRNIVSQAHRIGQLARTFEAYLKAGGKVIPSYLKQLQEQKAELPPTAQPAAVTPLFNQEQNYDQTPGDRS